MSPEGMAHNVKRRALELGFDSVGIADLSPTPHSDRLKRWLTEGMAGTMEYMHRQAARRREPSRILPGATRAVVVTKNHFRPDPPPQHASGAVAKYARGRDYHTALRGPLGKLASHIRVLGPPGTVAKSYVDAGPVPERELAQRAGLGWIGKNTMLIDPERGSFLFLGSVLTSLDLAIDAPFEADRCGTCRKCLDACPTHAFPEARVLDSRRCISYLTIEYEGEIDPDLASQMGTRVFGCDTCQDVCPWNVRFAEEARQPFLGSDPSLASLSIPELLTISDPEFERRYGWTALERPGPEGMKRNARVALANLSREAPCLAL